MKVGVFDSGVGGLTVAKSLYESRLFSDIVYYGDTARVPYGSKDQNTVLRYALEAIEFFNGVDVDFVVVACNTVSVVALAQMQQYSNKPVYGVIEPGVLALQQRQLDKNDDRILVIATKATINSGEYQRRIEALGYGQVIARATPLFVPLVEEQCYQGPILDAVLQHYFADLSAHAITTVVLGCTHYPLIAQAIAAYFNGALTIHSGEAMVAWLQQQLQLNAHFDKTRVTIYASENVAAVKRVAAQWGLPLQSDAPAK
ncbi:glutamate racemase [Idiomarina xiamenensis]|uniref:Glutamate racemase n=1 Tax=Idiomarina xiamenensis 10-D-4 TaxID=740709 RepID=K2KYH7_9GAMM|nr:glutamate racemase [Idiomarina xiamenensis]EKE87604.1 glutamate racemase [Idiomarina xiamenensis 10-D-4]